MTIEQEQRIIEAAETGVQNALTPGNDRFGAAVLSKDGNIYSSGQYFSDTLSLTSHSEQAALAHAAAHGKHDIVGLAVASNTGEIAYPCHMCKQLLWESHLRSGLDIEILITNDGKIVECFFLTKLMSHAWPTK